MCRMGGECVCVCVCVCVTRTTVSTDNQLMAHISKRTQSYCILSNRSSMSLSPT